METTVAPVPRAPSWRLASLLFAATLISGLLQAGGGTVGMSVGGAFIPAGFALMAVLARLGDTDPTARPFGLLLLWATLSALGLGSLALIVLHVVEPGTLGQAQQDVDLMAGGEARLTFMMGLMGLAAATTILSLFRAARDAVRDIIPIDPTLYSHALALATAVTITLVPLLPLFVLGKPPLPLPAHALPPGTPDLGTPSLFDRAIELAWFGIATLLVAGPGSRRTPVQTRDRLGLYRPRLWIVPSAVVAGLLLAWAWPHLATLLGVHPTAASGLPDAGGKESLAWPQAMVICLLISAGTELTYRGLLQPRLGLMLSNLVLTAPLAWTNAWNVLFLVFVTGLVFGVIRWRGGTIVSWLSHFTFLMATLWIGGG